MPGRRSTAVAEWGLRSPLRPTALRGYDCPGGGGRGGDGQGGGGSDEGGGKGGSGGHGGGDQGSDCRCHGYGPAHRCDCCQDRCCDRCGPGCGCRCGGSCTSQGTGRHQGKGRGGTAVPGDGRTLGWKNPNRPGRPYGVTTGRLPGGVVEPCDFDVPPWNTWPGTRGDLYLPYLLMRANAGDLGARPVVGAFWESPDILLLAGVDPAQAPPRPPDLGQTALAGKPNTLYAHVWNFGRSSAPNVVVEFYWCDPSLGIGPAGVHLIGVTTMSLGDRSSGRSHAVVICPNAWVPTFVNGGHECLLVRVWDESADGLGDPPWDAALNRHVAQRNIHVVAVGDQSPFAGHLLHAGPLTLPTPMAPLTLNVGPLYDEPAQVNVARVAPHEMPWLQLRTGTRGQFPAPAIPTGTVQLSGPTPVGDPTSGGGAATSQQVEDDGQRIALTTTDAMPAPGQAHVYRVTASQQGQVFGGYTVVLLG